MILSDSFKLQNAHGTRTRNVQVQVSIMNISKIPTHMTMYSFILHVCRIYKTATLTTTPNSLHDNSNLFIDVR